MGLFSNLFKKSSGGSIFGNFLRGASNKLTGGVLGNGAALAARNGREADQQTKDIIAAQVKAALGANPAYNAGKSSTGFVAGATQGGQGTQYPAESADAKGGIIFDENGIRVVKPTFFEENKNALIVGVLAIVAFVIYHFSTQKTKKKY